MGPMHKDEQAEVKQDGRKKAWYVKKIEQLEAEIEFLKSGKMDPNDLILDNAIYAEGFVDAMHRFQIRNKSTRSKIKDSIVKNGKGAVKRIRGSLF